MGLIQPPSEHTLSLSAAPFQWLTFPPLIFSPPTESYPCSTCIQPPFGNSPELSFFNSPNQQVAGSSKLVIISTRLRSITTSQTTIFREYKVIKKILGV
jgi:hypothetical protein